MSQRAPKGSLENLQKGKKGYVAWTREGRYHTVKVRHRGEEAVLANVPRSVAKETYKTLINRMI